MTSKKLKLKWSGRPCRSRERGFTLIELLIAATLVSMVALGFAAMYGTAQTYLADAMNLSGAQGEAGFAIEHIARRVRTASSVTIAALPARQIDVTIPITGGTRTMRYAMTGSALVWTPNTASPGTTVTLVTNLATTPTAGLTFTQSGSAVTITVETIQGPRRFPITTTVSLRGQA